MADLARARRPIQNLIRFYTFKLLFSVLLFLLVINGSYSVPRGPSNIPKCASFCTESSRFKYDTKSTYVYDYSTDVSTYVVHGSSGESRVHLSSKVEITPITSCDFQLKLKEVKIEESQLENPLARTHLVGSEALIQELQQRPLQFTFQNGKIESICADRNESVWNLNVKRGILSMLQNTMDKGQLIGKPMQEADVNGKCQTTYSAEDSAESQLVHKSKDLKSCNHRHSHISGIQSIPYTSASPIQSLPLLTGSQTCSQVIKDGKITVAECEEEHSFQPFDYINSGARTNVVQKLTLTHEQPSQIDLNADVVNIRKTTLLFESEQNRGENSLKHSLIEHVLKYMAKLEENNVAKIGPNTPEVFLQLIDELRSINLPSLKLLHSKASAVGKTFMLDALPLVGTSPASAFMRDLYIKAQLLDSQADTWLTSLVFIKHPSIDMISALEPLLDGSLKPQALFGISSMVNAYCRENDDCTLNPVIFEIVQKLYDLLGSCEVSNANVHSETFLNVLYALKSIGNAGRLVPLETGDADTKEAQHLIEKCYNTKSNPIEIRLAAIDSFRRMSCSSYNHHSLVKRLKDVTENTEIRIQAYLTLMRCPSNDLLETIKDIFYTDNVNQVVSFMWSHLTNLQETSSPDKQAIRELLSNDELQRKFSQDARKYSRNYEGTKYLEEYNVGFGYDANLIFSSESFIPRSGMINLTSHLFGESINMLEFGVRVHSMEHLLEPIFGPAGYFPDQTMNQALHNMRVRRDVASNKADRLTSIYDQATHEINEPGGSFYTRIFGNEITAKSFQISHKDRTVPTVIDENGKNWMDLTYWLDNMSKGKSLEYTKSNVLMDLSYTVPTSAGLPLTLDLKSATTVRISADGKIDMEKFWDNKELEISGRLHPSAAVQVFGTMLINIGGKASNLNSGLKIENTLHTSTSVEGKVLMNHGKLAHASLGLPKDKQEIFEAKSQLYLVKVSGDKVEEMGSQDIKRVDKKLCTPKMMETILGIRICGEANAPEPFGPSLFKSPFSYLAFVEKTDTFNSYEFDYRWERQPDKTDIALLFDTPGSKINRRVAIEYIYDWNDGIFKAGVEAPSKSLSIDGTYEQNSKKLELSAVSNNKRIVFMNVELKRQNLHIEPKLIILYYDKPIVEIDGSTVNLVGLLEGNGHATFDVSVRHLTQSRVNLNGEITRDGDTFSSNIGVISYLVTGSLQSQIKLDPNVLVSKIDVEYAMNGSPIKKSYNINGKIQKSRKGLLTKYYTIYSFKSSDGTLEPTNYDFTWDLQSGSNYCENNVKITMGTEIWDGKVVYSNQIWRTHKDLRFELLLNAPNRNIDYNFLISHQEADNGFTSKVIVKLNSKSEFKAYVGYLLGNNWQFKRNFLAGISWADWIDYSVKGSIDESKPGEFDGEITLTSNLTSSDSEPKEMKGTLAYKNRSSNTRIDHSMEIKSRGFNTTPISGSFALVASEKLSHIGGQLDIEGDEYYSGRWSGSLNYNAPKKNIRKIEGKLTIQEKKYNGVLNYKRTRNGDRTLVMDLNLDRRVFMQAQVAGSWPAAVNTYLSIIPDMTNSPRINISCQGTFDPKSVNINVNYFGQVAQFAGNYDQGKGQLQTNWVDNQQMRLSFDISKLGLRETTFIVDFHSPFTEDFSISLQHSFSRRHLSTQFNGNIGERRSLASISGVIGSPESQLSIMADIWQMKKVQVQLRRLRTGNEAVMDFNVELGEEKTNLRLEHSRTESAINCKVEFDGCSFVPQTVIKFSEYKMSSGQFVDVDVAWTPNMGTQNKITLHLETKDKPWNYALAVTTPWTPFNRVDMTLATELDSALLVDFTVGGTHELFPMRIKLKSDGEWLHSENEMLVSWTENQKSQAVRVFGTSQIESWRNSQMNAAFGLFDQKYALELTTHKSRHDQKVEIGWSVDNELSTTGVTWQCEKRGNLVKVTTWYESPNQPKIFIDYHHLNDENYFTLASHVKSGDKTLGQIVTEFHSTGFEHWEITAKLNSVLNVIPTISFTSHHSIEDLNEIRHTTEFLLSENSLKLWGGLEETKILLEFILKNGRDLSGSVKVNEKEVKLVGILENESISSSEEFQSQQGQKIDLEISSQLFEPIHTTAEYKVEYDNHAISIGFSGSRSGVKFIGLELNGLNDLRQNITSGSMNILSPFEHQVAGKGILDFGQRSIEVSFKETMQKALGFTISGQAKPQNGHLTIEFISKFEEPLNYFKINTNYKNENYETFELTGKYLDNTEEQSVNGVFIWKNHEKKVQLLVNNGEKIEFNIDLQDSKDFTGILTLEKAELFNVNANYIVSRETREFGMGKHELHLKWKSRNEFHNVVCTMGLDTNHVMLNLQTPFRMWKNWTFDTKLVSSTSSKVKTLTGFIENGEAGEKYSTQVEYGNGIMSFNLKSPIKSWSNLEAKLIYKLSEGVDAVFETVWETNKVAITGKVTTSSAELNVESPFDGLRQLNSSVKWNFENLVRTFEAFVQINDESQQLSGEWELQFSHGHMNVQATTLLIGDYKAGLNYSFMKDIQVQANFENDNSEKYEMMGKLTFGDKDIVIQLQSPYPGMENLYMKILYEQLARNAAAQVHSGSIEWSINGKGQSVSMELALEPGQVELKLVTPLKSWTQLKGTFSYKLDSESSKIIEISLEKELKRYLSLRTEFSNTGGDENSIAKNSFSVSLQTTGLLPTGYENVMLVSEYERHRSNYHTISARVHRNNLEVVQGKVNFMLISSKNKISVDVNGELFAPLFGIQLSSLNGTYLSETKGSEKNLQFSLVKRQRTLVLDKDDPEFVVKASYNWTPTQLKLQIQTPYKTLKNLHFDNHFESDGRIASILELNNKKIEMNGQLIWKGVKNFMFTTEIHTPFSNFQLVHAQVNSKILLHSVLVDYIFQNDNVRYMGKIDGSRDTDGSSGQIKIQLNSPIAKMEQILAAVNHNQTGAYFRIERNTKEEVFGFTSVGENSIQLNLKSKLTNYPIDLQSSVHFDGLLPNIDIGIHSSKLLDTRHRLDAQLTIRSGFTFGEINVNSTIPLLKQAKMQWNLNGDLIQGGANASWDLLQLGNKEIRLSWKNDNLQDVKLEAWLSSPKEFNHEKGFSLQFTLSPIVGNSGKFGGSLTYVLDSKEGQVTISTSLKKSLNTNTMELTLETPFDLLKQLTLTGRLAFSPEIVLDLSATRNNFKLFTSNVVTYISPLMSKLKFSMNAPVLSDAFNLNIGYDLTTTDKALDISFTQNKYQLTVKTEAIVPTNPDEIELRITVDSNVPSVTVSASGSLRAGYKIQADETRQIIVSVNSEQTGLWKITTSVRPDLANFNLKFKMDSPIPERIPSINTELLYSGSVKKNLNTELFIHVGNVEPIKATLGVSYQMIHADFISGIPGLEHLAFDGSLDSSKTDALNHKFHFGLKSGGDSLSFEGDVQVPAEGYFAKGSVKLSSSWDIIPSASLLVSVAKNGTADISGIWGERKLNLRGTMHKDNDKLSPWSSISTDFALSLNAEEIFHIQSKHFLSEHEKSLNLSMDDKFKFETSFKANPQFDTFFSSLEWAQNQKAEFIAEVGSGRFNASLKTPWISDIESKGEYRVSLEEVSAQTTFVFNGQQSNIEALILTAENTFSSRIKVDIPLLNQKLEANVKIVTPDEHYTEASVDMKMKDRRIAIKGSLATNVHLHSDNVEMEERLVKLSILLPTKKSFDLNGEFSVKKSVRNMNILQLESLVTVGLHTAKGRFHYKLPFDGSKSLSMGAVLDAPFISAEKYEGSIDIPDVNPLHFKGEINYKSNSLAVSWDIEENLSARFAANLPMILNAQSPIVVEMKGMFKLPKELQLRTTVTCPTQLLTLQASFADASNSLTSQVFVNAPTLISEPTEVTMKLSKVSSAHGMARILELTTTHGKQSFGVSGELISESNKVSANMKLAGYLGAHFISIVTSKSSSLYEVELNAESMTLLKGKKMSIVGKVKQNHDGFDGVLECRTRQAIHSISTSLHLNPRKSLISIKMESPFVKSVGFDAEYSVEQSAAKVNAKLSANIMNRSHVMKFGYDLHYFDAYLNIVSPMLSSQIFNIQFKSKFKENDIDFLGDVNVLGNEWKLEAKGVFEQNHHLEAKMEIRTPFEALHRVTIETALTSTRVHLEFYTPLDELPNFVFSLSDVPLFEEINWRNFNPQILVGLPWITYSAAGLVQLPSNTKPGEVSLVFAHGTPKSDQMKEFMFTAQISQVEELSLQMDIPLHVTLKILTPYTHLKSFQCKLGGRINLKSWSELDLSGEFNGKEIGFSSEVQKKETNKKFVLQLKTPYENFEETTFSIRVEDYKEIGTGQNIQIDFKRNKWDNPIHTELDYHYRISEYPLNMDGEMALHFPSSSELPPLFLRFNSRAMDIYNGVVEGRWGQFQPSLKVDFGYASERIFGSAEAKLGDDIGYQGLVRFDFKQQIHEISLLGEIQFSNEQLLFANMGFVQKHDVVKCNVLFKSILDNFKSVSAELRLSPLSRTESVTLEKLLQTLDVSLGITFNEVKLFQFELVSKHNQRSLEIHNPIQPISFIVSYRILPNKKLQVVSSFCWDLSNPSESTVGIGLNYARNPAGNDVFLSLQGGEYGSLFIDTSYEWSYKKFEQFFNLKWSSVKLEQNTTVGYYVLLEDEFISSGHNSSRVVRIDFPWRSIQCNYQTKKEFGQTKAQSTNIELKWDAVRDPTKRLGIFTTFESVTIRRMTTQKSTLAIAHSALTHDLVFEVEKVLKHHKLWEAQFVMKPNSFPQDQFTVRMSHENIKGVGVQLMVTHPATNIDINTIVSHSDSYSLFHFAYLDVRGESHVLHFEASKTSHMNTFELSTGSDVHNMNAIARLEVVKSADDSEREIKLKSSVLQIDSRIRTELPYVDVRIQYDEGEELTLAFGLPHKRKIILQAVRNEFGQNIQDLFLVAKFNTSDTLSTTMFWRPELFQDLFQRLSKGFPKAVGKSLDGVVPGILQRINEEVEERLKIIDPGLDRVFTLLKSHVSKEFNLLRSELQHLEKYIENLYNQNKFYLKDILRFTGKAFQNVFKSSLEVLELFEQTSISAIDFIANTYEKLQKLSTNYSGHLKDNVIDSWKSAEFYVATTWEHYMDQFNKILAKGQTLYDTIAAAIEGNLDFLEKKVYGIELVRKLNCLYEDYISWLDQLPIQVYLNQFRELFKEKVLTPLEEYYDPYFTIISQVIEDGNLYSLFEMPPVPYIRNVATNVLNLSTGLWKFVEAEQRIRDSFGEILDRVNNLIQRHIPLSKLTIEMEKGHIEYHQPLTFVEWPDFIHLPKWKILEKDEEDISQINEIYFHLLDTIRTTQPFADVDIRKIIPPFGSNAIMAGNHHYLTFDKRYFRFAGECSYILIADLSHRNFTLVVNYENVGGELKKKSYSLMSGGKVIEFDTTNLKVTLDGRKVELPCEVDSTFIRRQPSGLEIFDSRGFQMQCGMKTDVCRISVSGWHFGKLGGLLGTYDNEPSNDMKTPDGQIVDDVATFAHSWRVGSKSGQCRMKNFAREFSHYQDAEGVCHEYLTKFNSMFRPCFSEVSATPFIEMCKYDTTLNLNSVFRSEAACTGLAAYVAECQKNGVDLWVPPSCVRCTLEDGSTVPSGENVTIGEDKYVKTPKSSDVIILIEEAPKLKNFNLNDVMSKLDTALKVEGLTNNRYAVVGYGGNGPYFRPHIRTSSGQVWATNTLLKIPESFPMNGKANADLFEAIEYGATIGFRAGVSKTIIAFIATDESSKGMNRQYADTLTLLVENDIKLHILSPDDLTLKGNKREDGNKLFGFDMSGVYTLWQSKRGSIESDKSIRRYVNIPKDLYTPLAMETSGTRFNMNLVRSTVRKTFLDVWSRLVAKASQPSKCQYCECVPDKLGGATMLCQQCVSPTFKLFLENWDEIRLEEEPTIAPADTSAESLDYEPELDVESF